MTAAGLISPAPPVGSPSLRLGPKLRAVNEETKPAKGLPGGIALPASILVASLGLFMFAYAFPGILSLGEHVHPGGLGVLGAAASAFWLLIAIAKRPPPT